MRGVRFSAGAVIFPFAIMFVLATGPTQHPVGDGENFPGDKAVGDIKLTVCLHLLPRLRVRGAVPPFPPTSSWHAV
jgi:hypothetical protein